MSRTVQLRRYNLKPHLVEEFLAWWPTRLVPARAAYGFTVESAYLNREAAEFTWAVSAEGDRDEFRRLEQAWMASPERVAVFEGIDGWNDSTVIAFVERLV
jgi:antibiotic biosynthesis monooxygenase (ABM) superfamily enzyme